MRIILKSKHNLHYAEAEYHDDGSVIVYKGSKINLLDSFQGMSQELICLRHNLNVADNKGVLLRDISFKSPSTAAQFVTGRSVNGYIAWRPDDKMSLKEYLKQE